MHLPSTQTPTGLLLSGGLDSAILLGTLVGHRRRVQPFYVRSRLFWEAEELRATRRFVEALGSPLVDELVVLELPLEDVYEGHWSVTGDEPPDASSPDDAVFLPGRNAFLSIKAALWCRLNGIEELALGVLRSNPFADATPDFFDHLQAALNCGPGPPLRIIRPFAQYDKREVMELGREMPLEETFSCIAPSAGLHCGQCNKCAERGLAFQCVGLEDPTQYATAATPDPS
jgi:7-cyano-7-deazaguanine synthase